MNPIAVSFLVVSAVALLVVPRRWAPLPLIAGACYMTLSQGVDVGPLSFTVIRMLIAVGVIRVIVRGESLAGGLHGLDWLMVVWALWACFSSVFHEPVVGALVFRLGLIYNACGIYFLARIFCTSVDDGVRLGRTIAILLVPLAVAMIYEQVANHNLFSILGGVNELPEIRDGRLRASGPFAHPILAGTVGAVSLPLMIGIWPYHRMAAGVGILGCLAIVISSASSGPILSTLFGLGALFMWRIRHRMRLLRWTAVCTYIGLDIVMEAPAYYLIARMGVVGGSTGWHRGRLIESSIEHLNEWWLAGTDYTRHWMVTGLDMSPNQADITNHYLTIGVIGGLPLMLLLIAILYKAFSRVGRAVRDGSGMSPREQFVVWTFGSSLVAHAATWMSVSYFDQSVVFLYLTVAAIGSARPLVANAEPRSEESARLPQDRGRAHHAWRPAHAHPLPCPQPPAHKGR